MKKITRKRRQRDVRFGVLIRRGSSKGGGGNYSSSRNEESWLASDRWFYTKKKEGYNFSIDSQKKVFISLPETMNFSDQYESTIVYMTAIRKLSARNSSSRKFLRLASVKFDNLKFISSSASLVLTAELSKWDDAKRQRLIPRTEEWDPDILKRFQDLGFFNLFHNHQIKTTVNAVTPVVRVVRYIKENCGTSEQTGVLKERIKQIVGKNISKWTFLYSGLSEAITNVSHHAYPESTRTPVADRNWYIGGAYNTDTTELKIVFFDQGIGIPKSLPTSEIGERVLDFLSSLPAVDRKKDEVMLKAAVELTRTKTAETDRGKGLQDLLEFIKRRGDGYLSIISSKGLYKFTAKNGKEHAKTANFENPMYGTLIIWKVTLDPLNCN